MRVTTTSVVGVFGLIFAAGTASALTVNFELTGTINTVVDPQGFLNVVPGETFQLVYSFDVDTSSPPIPSSASLHSVDLRFAGVSVPIEVGSWWNRVESASDMYMVYGNTDRGIEFNEERVDIYLSSATAFGDGTLPLEPVDLSEIGLKSFEYAGDYIYELPGDEGYASENFEVSGTITSWTPEPSSLLLLMGGLPLLRRRRTS